MNLHIRFTCAVIDSWTKICKCTVEELPELFIVLQVLQATLIKSIVFASSDQHDLKIVMLSSLKVKLWICGMLMYADVEST